MSVKRAPANLLASPAAANKAHEHWAVRMEPLLAEPTAREVGANPGSIARRRGLNSRPLTVERFISHDAALVSAFKRAVLAGGGRT